MGLAIHRACEKKKYVTQYHLEFLNEKLLELFYGDFIPVETKQEFERKTSQINFL